MTNGVPLGTVKDVVYRVISSDPSMILESNNGGVDVKIDKDDILGLCSVIGLILCCVGIAVSWVWIMCL